MAKVRVHELAKEFGLDNKDVLSRLQAAGIQVKSHSSSVYEDEARAVLRRGAAAPEPAAPVRRPGMMIIRKAKTDVAVPTEALEAGGQPSAAALEAAETGAASEAQAERFGGEATVAELAEGAEAPAGEQASGESDAEAAIEPSAEAPTGEAASATTEGEAVTGQAQSEHTAAAGRGTPAEKGPQAPEPAGAKVVRGRPRTAGVSATVVGRIDREKLLERVPQRRLGGGSGAPAQRFGQVTELQVVTDPFGRGREMIDVGRDKKGKPGVKTTVVRKTRAPTKREMIEMRERALLPARLKKKKAQKRGPGGRKVEITQPRASKRVIRMRETVAIIDLAQQLGVKATEVIAKLMALGTMVTINQSIDFDTAQLLANEYGYTVDSQAFNEDEILESAQGEEAPDDVESRPPVVTVMGHVDHGKTSLLDAIRKTDVAAGEAGGITQHIGAYQVTLPDKRKITFLDTPGHAAFTAMRARGAELTDLVILVVAADDGMMPQTEEAVRHAQAAEVPIIVAVNKIDKPEAQPERVMQQLAKFELLPEAWGGQTLYVNTSATKRTGISELLDAILLQSEMMELKANPKRPASGIVVEAKLDKGRGPVATVLVQQGTLKRGDPLVVGEFAGKVRAMTDDQGRQVSEAPPATPVEIIGLEGVPQAGDGVNVVESFDAAREVATHRQDQKRSAGLATGPKVSLDELMSRMQAAETLELKLVLKADVQGSVEAVRDAVVKLSTEKVKVSVLFAGVGGVTETDIMLAAASQGIVIGFGVRPDGNARSVAEREGVEIRIYTIIYELLDDVRRAMEGLLAPVSREKFIGRAEVREVFRVSKVGSIAGCRVVEGKALRSARVRVLRDSVQVYDGRVGSLKHFKDDVREVESGLECGVGIEGYNDIKAGDALEFYQVEEVAATLEGAAPATKRAPAKSVEAHP